MNVENIDWKTGDFMHVFAKGIAVTGNGKDVN